jgi:hypothetical protein
VIPAKRSVDAESAAKRQKQSGGTQPTRRSVYDLPSDSEAEIPESEDDSDVSLPPRKRPKTVQPRKQQRSRGPCREVRGLADYNARGRREISPSQSLRSSDSLERGSVVLDRARNNERTQADRLGLAAYTSDDDSDYEGEAETEDEIVQPKEDVKVLMLRLEEDKAALLAAEEKARATLNEIEVIKAKTNK